jgi:hypothetical protein
MKAFPIAGQECVTLDADLIEKFLKVASSRTHKLGQA